MTVEKLAAVNLAEAHTAAEEYAARFGEPDPNALAEIRAQLAAAGVGMPESQEDVADGQAVLGRLHGDTWPNVPGRSV